MELFKDIYNFVNVLSFVDIIFLVAIIVLLILIVTLIYFIKINKEEEDTSFIDNSNNSNKDNIAEEKKEDVLKINGDSFKTEENIIEDYNDEEAPLMDLETLTKKLKEEEDKKNDSDRVEFTEYEKDQEEKAIISYDELLNKNKNYAINYEKEEVVDDLVVKKVNLNDLVNKDEKIEIESDVRVISYDHEEAFLNALKELNKLLS